MFSLYPPVPVAQLFHSIRCQVCSCFASNGPRSASTCTWHLPLKLAGTRHEYRQVPPQPYLNSPVARTTPAWLSILSFGGGCHCSFFITPPTYLSPACPSTMRSMKTSRPLVCTSVLIRSGGPGFALLPLKRDKGWPLTRSRTHLSPFSSVMDSSGRPARGRDEVEQLRIISPIITARTVIIETAKKTFVF